jgi:hypothetical protein
MVHDVVREIVGPQISDPNVTSSWRTGCGESVDVLTTLGRGLSWGIARIKKIEQTVGHGPTSMTRRGQIHSRLQPSYRGILVV